MVGVVVRSLVINAVNSIVGVGIVNLLGDGGQFGQLGGISAEFEVEAVVGELLADVRALLGDFRVRLVVRVQAEHSSKHSSQGTEGVGGFPSLEC